ncbi:hypothetical protein SBY92_002198 [Candida maltosa Xu316]
MSTQVHLNPTKLSILSISRDKYWIFISSILQLLYKSIDSNLQKINDDDDDDSNNIDEYSSSTTSSFSDHDGPSHRKSVDNSSKNDYENGGKSDDDEEEYDEEEDYFFHIAMTPDECTIICSQKLMKQYFQQPIDICKQLNYTDVELLPDRYLSLFVDCVDSGDNSLRILELTKPLSENNISLFFISSHFNDIVLIPYVLKKKVVNILMKKNFQFSDISKTYLPVATGDGMLSPMIDDNQAETFKLFKESNIHPLINKHVKLLLTGSRPGEVNNTILKSAKILSSTESIPKYFSITRTYFNEVSLILPKSSKKRNTLGFDSKFIMGSVQDVIIPITIDFSKLPLDSTGIVAGLASKLITGKDQNLVELYYFSMAKSGVIMIPQENLQMVSEILSK